MKKLRNRDLIIVDPETGNIELTASGIDIAKEMYERHNVLTNVLASLGVPLEIARKDACKIEHDLSEETYLAIKNHIQKYKQ